MNVQDVEEWLIADDPEFNINDNEFVQSALHDFNNTSFLEEIEEPEEKFSFNTAYSALQISLSFLEKQQESKKCLDGCSAF